MVGFDCITEKWLSWKCVSNMHLYAKLSTIIVIHKTDFIRIDSKQFSENYKKDINLSVDLYRNLKPYWTFYKYVNVISLNAMLYNRIQWQYTVYCV